MTALPDDAPGSNDTRVTYQDGQRYEIRHTVTIPWKERDGRQQQNEEVVQPGAKTIKAARARAIKRGYPGHRGGRWNWFVDDAHRFLVGKRKCPAGNCNIHRTGIYA